MYYSENTLTLFFERCIVHKDKYNVVLCTYVRPFAQATKRQLHDRHYDLSKLNLPGIVDTVDDGTRAALVLREQKT